MLVSLRVFALRRCVRIDRVRQEVLLVAGGLFAMVGQLKRLSRKVKKKEESGHGLRSGSLSFEVLLTTYLY